jgi:hypothetical protein
VILIRNDAHFERELTRLRRAEEEREMSVQRAATAKDRAYMAQLHRAIRLARRRRAAALRKEQDAVTITERRRRRKIGSSTF